jgi:hypothetical protein
MQGLLRKNLDPLTEVKEDRLVFQGRRVFFLFLA